MLGRPDFLTLGPVAEILPGESHRAFASPGASFRATRIVARTVLHEPDVRDYHKRKRAGGSRRKGRRASWEWGAARLKHFTGRWPQAVDVVEVVVDRWACLVCGKVPIALFGPEQFSSLALPTGRELTVVVRNADERRVTVAMTAIVQR